MQREETNDLKNILLILLFINRKNLETRAYPQYPFSLNDFI